MYFSGSKISNVRSPVGDIQIIFFLHFSQITVKVAISLVGAFMDLKRTKKVSLGVQNIFFI